MALNVKKLESDIAKLSKNTNTPKQFARGLASIIDKYIRSADVITTGQGTAPPGIPVVGGLGAGVTTAPVVTAVTSKGKIV